ncbi:MAG: hypothetical protein QF741_00440 [Candidatus Peribacteraceae bacterium]|jgi:hypothetical protein|nr:hypothetical protein [Candidatus Peribacteraceae bacterium]MDP7454205.1 hypothetical protein [Candidatus Peribacteraceae bacterium]MDP7646131.1 hypothetical protein [Candidatus Peribacteraceae bacterium]
MTPREIIAKAWAITKQESQIRRWGYAAAVAETLLNIKLLIYQVWFLISYLQGDPIGFFTVEATLMKHIPMWLFITFMVTLVILLTIEWLFPHLSRGAIIGLAAKKHKGEEVKGGLVLAIYNFFPIFAIHEIFFLGRVTVVITIISLLLRYAGAIAPIAIGMLLLFYFCSLLIHFFCIFAEEAVVIKKLGIGGALKNSFKLVISYLGQVIFLLLLFFVIVLRVILNLIMVILIPGIVIGIGFLLTLFLPITISYVTATILGLILVGIASYFFAYLAVFKQTIWTITYMELSKLKELDIIEIEE